MSFGYHIHNTVDLKKPDGFSNRLTRIYADAGEHGDSGFGAVSQKWHHLYIGDEFCIHRLPDLDRLKALVSFSKQLGLPLTLLTPVVSDFGIEACTPLLELLSDDNPGSEIVVNDWGMLFFLKENFPAFQLALGRVLNKGFKDPRVPFSQVETTGHESMFHCSTFDFDIFRKKARTFGVNRLERDLLPYGKDIPSGADDPAISIYFPYGYITTGRICKTAALTGHEKDRFAINSQCSQVCESVNFRIRHPHFPFKMIQSGNTVFYLYPPETCHKLLSQAPSADVRLIFQDLLPEKKAGS